VTSRVKSTYFAPLTWESWLLVRSREREEEVREEREKREKWRDELVND
jgi:hypothetical protein